MRVATIVSFHSNSSSFIPHPSPLHPFSLLHHVPSIPILMVRENNLNSVNVRLFACYGAFNCFAQKVWTSAGLWQLSWWGPCELAKKLQSKRASGHWVEIDLSTVALLPAVSKVKNNVNLLTCLRIGLIKHFEALILTYIAILIIVTFVSVVVVVYVAAQGRTLRASIYLIKRLGLS